MLRGLFVPSSAPILSGVLRMPISYVARCGNARPLRYATYHSQWLSYHGHFAQLMWLMGGRCSDFPYIIFLCLGPLNISEIPAILMLVRYLQAWLLHVSKGYTGGDRWQTPYGRILVPVGQFSRTTSVRWWVIQIVEYGPSARQGNGYTGSIQSCFPLPI